MSSPGYARESPQKLRASYAPEIWCASFSGPDPALRNTYSLLRVSRERFGPGIRAEEARALEAWLLGAEAQRSIGEFGRERFGRSLFRPLQLAADRPGDAH